MAQQKPQKTHRSNQFIVHSSWFVARSGHGTAVIAAKYEVQGCGEYKFGFACYDKLGNIHEGTPEEATLHIHIAPAAPAGLKKNSYNKDTDVLVLTAA